MTTFTDTRTFTVICCATCAMDFGVPERFEKDRRDDHGGFTCPKGHSNVFYGKSDEEKLCGQLNREKDRHTRTRHELDQEESRHKDTKHSLRAQKAAKTRLKKRIANGVCPCCNHSFKNLHRHISSQHPNFVKTK